MWEKEVRALVVSFDDAKGKELTKKQMINQATERGGKEGGGVKRVRHAEGRSLVALFLLLDTWKLVNVGIGIKENHASQKHCAK